MCLYMAKYVHFNLLILCVFWKEIYIAKCEQGKLEYWSRDPKLWPNYKARRNVVSNHTTNVSQGVILSFATWNRHYNTHTERSATILFFDDESTNIDNTTTRVFKLGNGLKPKRRRNRKRIEQPPIGQSRRGYDKRTEFDQRKKFIVVGQNNEDPQYEEEIVHFDHGQGYKIDDDPNYGRQHFRPYSDIRPAKNILNDKDNIHQNKGLINYQGPHDWDSKRNKYLINYTQRERKIYGRENNYKRLRNKSNKNPKRKPQSLRDAHKHSGAGYDFSHHNAHGENTKHEKGLGYITYVLNAEDERKNIKVPMIMHIKDKHDRTLNKLNKLGNNKQENIELTNGSSDFSDQNHNIGYTRSRSLIIDSHDEVRSTMGREYKRKYKHNHLTIDQNGFEHDTIPTTKTVNDDLSSYKPKTHGTEKSSDIERDSNEPSPNDRIPDTIDRVHGEQGHWQIKRNREEDREFDKVGIQELRQGKPLFSESQEAESANVGNDTPNQDNDKGDYLPIEAVHRISGEREIMSNKQEILVSDLTYRSNNNTKTPDENKKSSIGERSKNKDMQIPRKEISDMTILSNVDTTDSHRYITEQNKYKNKGDNIQNTQMSSKGERFQLTAIPDEEDDETNNNQQNSTRDQPSREFTDTIVTKKQPLKYTKASPKLRNSHSYSRGIKHYSKKLTTKTTGRAIGREGLRQSYNKQKTPSAHGHYRQSKKKHVARSREPIHTTLDSVADDVPDLISTKMPYEQDENQDKKVFLKSGKSGILELEELTPYCIARQLRCLKDENAEIKQEVIGRTAEYRDIVMWKMSSGKNTHDCKKRFRASNVNKYEDEAPQKKIIFIVHGLAVMGWQFLPCLNKVKKFKKLVSYYVDNLDLFDIFLLPMANPDGVAKQKEHPITPNIQGPYFLQTNGKTLWNKNVSPQNGCPGVALDRNFDVAWNLSTTKSSSCSPQFPGERPFSERETEAIRDVFHKYGHKIVGFFNVHAGEYFGDIFKGDAVLYPKGYTEVQSDDDKYIDLRGEIEEAMKNASFKVLSVAVDTLYNWYGQIAGSSVDYASTIYGIPYALDLVMQLYYDDRLEEDPDKREQNTALTKMWRPLLNVIFKHMYNALQKNEK